MGKVIDIVVVAEVVENSFVGGVEVWTKVPNHKTMVGIIAEHVINQRLAIFGQLPRLTHVEGVPRTNIK